MLNETIYREYLSLIRVFGIDAFATIYGGYFNFQRQRIQDKKESLTNELND